MGQPKRRTSKRRKNMRRGVLKLKTIQTIKCKHCGAETLPHKMCSSCNKYNS